jgi:hypothetical protein
MLHLLKVTFDEIIKKFSLIGVIGMTGHDVKVIISVDAEFTINSAFANPAKYLPSSTSLFSPVSNQDTGFEEVLKLLKKHSVQATFFTEALNSHFFGIDAMKNNVIRMLLDDHDVQLHAHPVWQEFKCPDWRDNVVNKKLKDNFFDLSSSEIESVLKECIDIFQQWTGERPIAFRAGNLQACPALYEALEKTGFTLASNIGLPIFRPNEELLHLENRGALINNIIEVPVTSFQSMGCRHKSLTITGTSSKEMKKVLHQCKSKGVEYVVILTHIHEFIKINSTNSKIKSNKVNLKRLDELCSFVQRNEGFKFETFNNLININKNSLKNSENIQDINTSVLSGLWTILENKINDKVWVY